MPVDPRAFRDAMGCFATAVTVVTTTTGDGRPVGVTVNSFNSVSLDPPLVLFNLGRNASNLQEFLSGGKFAVNVLRADQQHVSSGFANSGGNHFDELEHEVSELGCPLIPGAIAVFECETETTYDGGDHIIFIGRVHRVRHQPDDAPLMYYRGRYAALS